MSLGLEGQLFHKYQQTTTHELVTKFPHFLVGRPKVRTHIDVLITAISYSLSYTSAVQARYTTCMEYFTQIHGVH
jgi:hypothetical protein